MRKPDLHGHADAWVIPIDKTREGWLPDWDGTLCLYLLHCTWSHPMWSWYHICGIHLRDIPGVKPPHKHFPEASHEIMILALNPRMKPDPDLLAQGKQDLDFLTPPDLIHQVTGITDDQFKQLVQEVVVTIVEGRMAPDQDFRGLWRRAIDATVQHIKEGKHKPQ